jgi:redox-sensitive bicupin YhaK (pirin superfamily)
MSTKTLLRTHDAHRDDIGDLVTWRPLPGPGLDALDPFLFLNHHGPQVYPPGNRGLPFGPHPHRGFETVTFLVDGELAHRDSAGHESVIEAGGVQWMTAGRGIVHAEVSPDTFRRRGGPLEILQLWVNLPARLKMTAPRYVGLPRDAIPRVATPDGRGEVGVIAGTFGGTAGPVSPLAGVFMSTATVAAGGTLALDGLAGRTVFLYVVRGRVSVGGGEVRARQLAELSVADDALALAAVDDSLVLLGHATPFGEPIVAHGPFVMNTRDEIVAAVRDYQAGRFADLPA